MANIVKAISLHQPWASFIPMGFKKFETRHWPTSYRGEILICAAKKQTTAQSEIYAQIRQFARQNKIEPQIHMPTWFTDLPFGQVVAIASLVSCNQMSYQLNTGQQWTR